MRSVVGQHAAHARSHARNESHLGASTQHEHIGVGAGGEWAAHSSAARAGPPVLQQSVCRQAKLEGVQLGRWCPFYQQGGKNGVHKGAWQRLGWGHITRRGVMPPLSLHCAGGTWHPRVHQLLARHSGARCLLQAAPWCACSVGSFWLDSRAAPGACRAQQQRKNSKAPHIACAVVVFARRAGGDVCNPFDGQPRKAASAWDDNGQR